MSRLSKGKSGDPWYQLGLSRAACGPEDVNRAYRRLAVLLHPDKTAASGADEAFKALGAARRAALRALGQRI